MKLRIKKVYPTPKEIRGLAGDEPTRPLSHVKYDLIRQKQTQKGQFRRKPYLAK